MDNKILTRKIAFASLTPVLAPGIIFYTYTQGHLEKVFVFSLLLLAAIYLFHQYWSLFVQTKGFFKRFVSSWLLVNSTMLLMALAPADLNFFSSLPVFLYALSIGIAIYWLSSCDVAKQVAGSIEKTTQP